MLLYVVPLPPPLRPSRDAANVQAYTSLTEQEQDAAIAAAAVLNLVDPSMTGIGGDAFCLFYDAWTKRVHALNGSGRSPSKATVDDICRDLDITDRIFGTIPPTSIHSVIVPGAAAAWVDIVQKFGSGRVDRAAVLAPAIQLAEEGVPVSEISSYYVSVTDFCLVISPRILHLATFRSSRKECSSGYRRKKSSGAAPTGRAS